MAHRAAAEAKTSQRGFQLPAAQASDGGGGGGGGAPGAPPARAAAAAEVVRDFHESLARSSDMAVAVAAITALTAVIRRSEASTMMGLERELKDAAAALLACSPSSISLKAGCELFLRYTTRTSALESGSFDVARRRLIERGLRFAETSRRARAAIAEAGARFVRPGARVLLHGHSRVALAVLRAAAARGTPFSVVVTEGRPDGAGLACARALADARVPVTVVLDAGVAQAMERVDMVLVGAEGVAESGGVISKLGTYGAALAAKAHSRPVYVAAESYKFARLLPLGQAGLPAERAALDFGPLLPPGCGVDAPSRDYTPPDLITLLFTDLGVLTPAAVSDELIQCYV